MPAQKTYLPQAMSLTGASRVMSRDGGRELVVIVTMGYLVFHAWFWMPGSAVLRCHSDDILTKTQILLQSRIVKTRTPRNLVRAGDAEVERFMDWLVVREAV